MKKRFIISIVVLALLFTNLFWRGASSLNSARALSGYERVITEDTPFFREPDGTGFIFYLPYTYYVKVLGSVGEYTHVECYGTGGSMTLDGFVPSNMLFPDGLEVTNPYARLNVVTAYETVLYSNTDLSLSIQYVFKDRELVYYGNALSSNGEKLYCVGYNNRLGYVKESDLVPFSIPNHPNELTFLNTPENSPPKDNESSENKSELSLDGLRIAVIVCLISAGLIALLLSFKRKPTAQNSVGYYDENDYG